MTPALPLFHPSGARHSTSLVATAYLGQSGRLMFKLAAAARSTRPSGSGCGWHGRPPSAGGCSTCGATSTTWAREAGRCSRPAPSA